ncbi:MAG: ATP-binding protein [Myxococcota bacterium]|nr:ATP-binding protein [Myxococcota bacterium]
MKKIESIRTTSSSDYQPHHHQMVLTRLIEVVNKLISNAGDAPSFIKQLCDELVDEAGALGAWAILCDETLEVCADVASGMGLDDPDATGPEGPPHCLRTLLEDEGAPNCECTDPTNPICHRAATCNKMNIYCGRLGLGDKLFGALALALPSEEIASSEWFTAVSCQASVALHALTAHQTRIAAEQERHDSEQRLELALKGANLGLWDWQLETGEVVFDGYWSSLIGFDRSRASDEREIHSWETLIHSDDAVNVSEVFSAHLAGRTPFFESEHRLRLKSGQWIWVMDRGCIIERSPDGTPLRAAGTILDITARKKSDEEREKLADQLRQIQKIESIGRLAGGIAHDLNNLLSPIIGYSEMALIDLQPEDTLYEELSQIRFAAERAKDLTHQLLAFSRKQVLKMQALNINDIVNESKIMLRRLIREDIEISYRLAPDLGTTKADSSQIQQILMNLALNAADSMPNGGKMAVETRDVELDQAYIACRPIAKMGKYVVLLVSDTGVGMDSETLGVIFEPFFTTKEKGQGTGLGLSTVYGIVKQHGGYVWAYSEPGYGTTFKIYLPRIDAAAQTNGLFSREPETAYGTETVLVVEDEEAVRRLICKILDKQGYQVIEADTTDDAVVLAAHHPSRIHLLLTDIVMPGMNGKELYERVATLRPDIKVLYMSGYTDDVIAHHGILDDGVRFVQKPFSVEGLTKKVRNALDE